MPPSPSPSAPGDALVAPPAVLQPQDLALTVLGAYVRDPDQTTWSGAMVELLRAFGFSTEASRAALARLVTRGLLERHRDGRLVHYSVTPQAQRVLESGDRRIFSFGRSEAQSDSWTMLWHGLPEDRRLERSRLAAQLRFLGFGSVQDATWLAASDREADARALLDDLGVASFAAILVGGMSPTLSPATIIAAAWDLDRVCAGYRGFLARYEAFAEAPARAALDGREAFVTRTRMLDEFRTFPAVDPELSRELAPEVSALRSAVVATFDAAFAGLRDAADAYFSTVAAAR